MITIFLVGIKVIVHGGLEEVGSVSEKSLKTILQPHRPHWKGVSFVALVDQLSMLEGLELD